MFQSGTWQYSPVFYEYLFFPLHCANIFPCPHYLTECIQVPLTDDGISPPVKRPLVVISGKVEDAGDVEDQPHGGHAQHKDPLHQEVQVVYLLHLVLHPVYNTHHRSTWWSRQHRDHLHQEVNLLIRPIEIIRNYSAWLSGQHKDVLHQ